MNGLRAECRSARRGPRGQTLACPQDPGRPLGRTAKAIENYDDGSPAAGEYDKDRVTEGEYDCKGRLMTLIAQAPNSTAVVEQETRYLYASDHGGPW
jgi:hypothetical protein